jgi:hypothetical protein
VSASTTLIAPSAEYAHYGQGPPGGEFRVQNCRFGIRWIRSVVFGVVVAVWFCPPSPSGRAGYLADEGRGVTRVARAVSLDHGDVAEPAILTEHISAWSDARVDADDLLAIFDLTPAEQTRVQGFRRVAALYWLIMLRPAGPSSTRNPADTPQRQADRLLRLLT